MTKHNVDETPLPSPPPCAELAEAPSPAHQQPAANNWQLHWPGICARITKTSRLLLAVGFDGVVSPAVSRPTEAAMTDETHELLIKLGESPRVTLAFFSGRSLEDIQTRVAIPRAYYVGNHGIEVHGPDFSSFDGIAASCRGDIVDAYAFLAKFTKRLRGVRVEDKGFGVTLHWRHVEENNRTALNELLNIIVKSRPRLQAFSGDECWELRARASWNKWDALQQILNHAKLTPADTLYMGAENTDNDVFTAMPGGLKLCVRGMATTSADYTLADSMDAEHFLFCLFFALQGVQSTASARSILSKM